MSKTTKSKTKNSKKASSASNSIRGKAKNNKKLKENVRKTATSESSNRVTPFWIYAIPVILFLTALFITLCLVTPGSMGVLGPFLKNLFFGLFSKGCLFIPILIFFDAFFFKKDVESGAVVMKTVCAVSIVISISVLFYVFSSNSQILDGSLDVISFWNRGISEGGGGVIGGVIGWLFYRAVGKTGTVIIFIAILALASIYFAGMTLYRVVLRIQQSFQFIRERRDEFIRREEEEASQRNSEAEDGDQLVSEREVPFIHKRDRLKTHFFSRDNTTQSALRGKIDLSGVDAQLDASDTESNENHSHIPEIIKRFNKNFEEREANSSEATENIEYANNSEINKNKQTQ